MPNTFGKNTSNFVLEDLLIYESNGIGAINKQSGMISEGNYHNSVERLISEFQVSSFKPSVAHRLDGNTTGIILFAWDKFALRGLQDQFKDRSIKKEYVALLDGTVEEKNGVINSPVFCRKKDSQEGTYKEAITEYSILQTNNQGMSYVRFKPRTGRTHQLRLHSANFLKAPIIGDRNYHENFIRGAFKKNESWLISSYTKAVLSQDVLQQMDGQMLHAKNIKFKHPVTNKEIFLQAPLPDNRENIWRGLGFNPDVEQKRVFTAINGGENIKKWCRNVIKATSNDNDVANIIAKNIANSVVKEFNNVRHLKMRAIQKALDRHSVSPLDREKIFEFLSVNF